MAIRSRDRISFGVRPWVWAVLGCAQVSAPCVWDRDRRIRPARAGTGAARWRQPHGRHRHGAVLPRRHEHGRQGETPVGLAAAVRPDGPARIFQMRSTATYRRRGRQLRHHVRISSATYSENGASVAFGSGLWATP